MQRIDRHFRALTEVAFSRYGHAYADVLGNWPAIVGEELAAIARPERLAWPGKARDEQRREGATLIVRVAEGRGLEVQHEALRIVERINGFFGYGAVASLKIRQGPLPERASVREVPEPSAEAASAVEARVSAVADERLKDALRRLGRSLSVSNTKR